MWRGPQILKDDGRDFNRSTVRFSIFTKLLDFSIIIMSTLRLTRFVTRDSLGGWLIREPVYKWANFNPDDPSELNNPVGWRAKWVSGAECPFCWGTWIGFAVLASWGICRHYSFTLRVWRIVMAGLGMNYVVGHISVTLD